MKKEQNFYKPLNPALRVGDVGSSIPSQAELVAETADAYCPNCDAYIVNERVTYEECCDTCGTDVEWHE
jgi:Zn finger protein HypA/HybF involved in hydrogenase expression